MADLGSIPADTHVKCCRCQKGSLAEVTHVDITCGHNEPSNFFCITHCIVSTFSYHFLHHSVCSTVYVVGSK